MPNDLIYVWMVSHVIVHVEISVFFRGIFFCLRQFLYPAPMEISEFYRQSY